MKKVVFLLIMTLFVTFSCEKQPAENPSAPKSVQIFSQPPEKNEQKRLASERGRLDSIRIDLERREEIIHHKEQQIDLLVKMIAAKSDSLEAKENEILKVKKLSITFFIVASGLFLLSLVTLFLRKKKFGQVNEKIKPIPVAEEKKSEPKKETVVKKDAASEKTVTTKSKKEPVAKKSSTSEKTIKAEPQKKTSTRKSTASTAAKKPASKSKSAGEEKE